MKVRGFALIELLVFIIVTGLLMTGLVLSLKTPLTKTPSVHQQWVALQTAEQCMEWYINQRRLNGYTAFSCPSSSVPTACTAPSGYTIATNVSCTTWNSDTNYKTVTVTMSGLAAVALSMQVGEY